MKSLGRHHIHRKTDPQHALLKCPKCPNRLKPLLLDMFEERGQTYQRVWWVCRGLKAKTCIFPLNMPPEVFWTRRTVDNIQHNVIPLPNLHLMPKPLRFLYPDLFKSRSISPQKPTVNTPRRSVSPLPPMDAVVREEASEAPPPSELPAETENDGFEALANRESFRRKPGRPPGSEYPILESLDSDSPQPLPETPTEPKFSNTRLKFKGMVSGSKTALKIESGLGKRGHLRASEVRRLNGGENFNYALVDEVVEPSVKNARVELFPDVRSSLNAALAIRFARNEVMERVTDRMCINGVMSPKEVALIEQRKLLQKVSEEYPLIVDEPRRPAVVLSNENGNSEASNSASRASGSGPSSRTNSSSNSQTGHPSTTMTNAFTAFRQAEHQLSIAARLGHRKKASEIAALATKTSNYKNVTSRIVSDESRPSTSTASVDGDAEKSATPRENIVGEFDSPELASIVQRHLQLLRNKKPKKPKKKAPTPKPVASEPAAVSEEAQFNEYYNADDLDLQHFNFETGEYHQYDHAVDVDQSQMFDHVDDPYGIFALNANNDFEDLNIGDETTQDSSSYGLNPPL